MEKFIPFKKLSKKEQRRKNREKRRNFEKSGAFSGQDSENGPR